MMLTRARFSGRALPRRLGVAAAMAAMAILGCMLPASPALAEVGNGLPGGGGHTCLVVGDDYAYRGVLCADLGLYTTRSGEQFLTAQVEVICTKDSTGAVVPCEDANATATVENGSNGYTDWTVQGCNNVPCTVNSSNHRTYMYPFGGLKISPGTCYADVWASIMLNFDNSDIVLPDGEIYDLVYDITTPSYKACENIYGAMSYTRL